MITDDSIRLFRRGFVHGESGCDHIANHPVAWLTSELLPPRPRFGTGRDPGPDWECARGIGRERLGRLRAKANGRGKD